LREWENNNILQDSTPKHVQRNTASPTLKQMKRNSINTLNNRNSQNIEIDTELRSYSGDKLESTSATERKPSSNLKNTDN
jgi:hypothetical protein